jgi:BMFP domain-containing protein YqiC
MIDLNQIDDLARRLSDLVPPGLRESREELQATFKSALQAGLAKLDLVTREEFEVQRAVLLKTRQKLDALETPCASWKGAAPQNEKGGAPRLPFTDYFPDGALQQGPPGALDSPACRSGSTERGSAMAQDTEWTPVSHDTCDQVAGPFYHGTALTWRWATAERGLRSNYRDSVVMNHISSPRLPRAPGWLRRWPGVKGGRACMWWSRPGRLKTTRT